MLVLKGGNALDFVWHPNRSTTDLDFSVETTLTSEANETRLAEMLTTSFLAAAMDLGIQLQPHRVRRNPPGPDKHFVTYECRIGYTIPTPGRPSHRATRGLPSAEIVRLDISVNEVICEDRPVTIGAAQNLRVSTLEDVVSEKLRALLQQGPRNRTRPQDLLDIAVIVRDEPPLDAEKISTFLKATSQARGIEPTRAAFHSDTLLQRAGMDYDSLRLTARHTMIAFGEAVKLLHHLVARLDIPDR